MKNRGFSEIYQIEGGIVRYGNKFADSSLWEGSLYTFDGRMTIDFSADAKLLGECEVCGAKTKDFRECSNGLCVEQVLLCDGCVAPECHHDLKRQHNAELIG